MKLYIQQRLFSFRDRFDIYDENYEPVYSVEGELFSLTHNLHVYDADNNEAAFLEKKFLSFLHRFTIQIPGLEPVEVTKEFSFFRPRYRIEGSDWRLEGDIFAHEYQLVSGNRPVLSITKKWLSWADSYELDIPDEEDALLALCIVLCVDAVLDTERSSN